MRNICLMDLDGTIIKGSAILQFGHFLIERGVIEDNIVAQEWFADMKNDKKISAFGDYIRKSITGKWVYEIAELAEEFINSDILVFYKSVFEKVQELKAKGYFICIISGSLDILVQHIAKKLGIHGYGAIYSTDKDKFTGEVEVPLFKSEIKQQKINEIINLSEVYDVIGFGDSVGDIAIALNSNEFYLVDPHIETIIEYNKLGIEYELLF